MLIGQVMRFSKTTGYKLGLPPPQVAAKFQIATMVVHVYENV